MARPLVVLPIRGFATGKTRLATVLSTAERAELVASMAATVVSAARGLPVLIVSSALDVVDWAVDHDLECLADPGSLDGAAGAGLEAARSRGHTHAIIVHADLPWATTLDAVVPMPGRNEVVAVRGHRDSGTTVITVPTTVAFRFSYGPGSFDRHLREARRLRVPTRVVRDKDLGTDLDTPEDLALFGGNSNDHTPPVALLNASLPFGFGPPSCPAPRP